MVSFTKYGNECEDYKKKNISSYRNINWNLNSLQTIDSLPKAGIITEFKVLEKTLLKPVGGCILKLDLLLLLLFFFKGFFSGNYNLKLVADKFKTPISSFFSFFF